MCSISRCQFYTVTSQMRALLLAQKKKKQTTPFQKQCENILLQKTYTLWRTLKGLGQLLNQFIWNNRKSIIRIKNKTIFQVKSHKNNYRPSAGSLWLISLMCQDQPRCVRMYVVFQYIFKKTEKAGIPLDSTALRLLWSLPRLQNLNPSYGSLPPELTN